VVVETSKATFRRSRLGVSKRGVRPKKSQPGQVRGFPPDTCPGAFYLSHVALLEFATEYLGRILRGALSCSQ
jgi:hypothetical protein